MEGEWIEEPSRVKEAVRDHFQRHFQKRGGVMARLSESFEVPRLGEAKGELLTRPFMEEEIREAVFDCDGSKTLGPDGFNIEFFK